MNPMDLHGRNALVIGGTRGIGAAIALQLARAGASVVANHVRTVAAADAMVQAAAAEGLTIELLRADATSDAGLAAIKERVAAMEGGLGCLVFAAATGVHRPFEQLTGRHFDFTFALNVKAFLAVVQAVSPQLTEGSTVVAVSSEGAERAVPQYHLVGASKGALESLARHLAVELAPRGVRVNVLSPGAALTDVWKVMPDAEQRLAREAARSPRGRLNTLDEIAMAALFLASPASSGLIGHTLVVDGGARMNNPAA